MLETILKEHGSELLGALTGGAGLDTGEAENLLPAALGGIGDALGSGNFDLGDIGSLMSGDGGGVSSLLGKLDLSGIAASAGLDEGKTESGLSSLIPVVMSLLGDKTGGGGAEGLLAMLGGGGSGGAQGALGALGGIAGKLFGK